MLPADDIRPSEVHILDFNFFGSVPYFILIPTWPRHEMSLQKVIS